MTRTQLPPEREYLVTDNVALVDFLARHTWIDHELTALSEDDLRGVGFLALVDAAIRYDPDRGPFSAWARLRIRGAMIDAIRKVAPELGRRKQYSRDELLSGRAGTGADAPSAVVGVRERPIELEDFVDPATSTETKYFKGQLASLIRDEPATLPERDRELMLALYVEEISMNRYAKRIGVNVSTVSRRHDALVLELTSRLVARNMGDA